MNINIVLRIVLDLEGSFQICYEVRITEHLEVDFGEDHQEADPHIVRVGWSMDQTSFQLGIFITCWYCPPVSLYIHSITEFVAPPISESQRNLNHVLVGKIFLYTWGYFELNRSI